MLEAPLFGGGRSCEDGSSALAVASTDLCGIEMDVDVYILEIYFLLCNKSTQLFMMR